MKKALTLREIISYGFLISVFVFSIVFLITIEEESTQVEFTHQYQSEFEDPSIVKIGVLIGQTEQLTQSNWNATAEHLTATIDNHSFVIVPLTYDEFNESVANDEVDFVIVNSSLYVELEVNTGVSRIATLNNKTIDFEATSYGAVLFTKTESSITTFKDIFSKTLGAVNLHSFGGYQMAMIELLNNDIRKTDIDIKYASTHEDVVLGVLDGTYDLGTVKTGIIEEMINDGLLALDDIKIINRQYDEFELIHSTQLYPEWPLAKTDHISEDLAAEVASALIAIEPTSDAALNADIAGWSVPQNYQDVHMVLQLLKASPYENYGETTLVNTIVYNRLLLIILDILIFSGIAFIFWLVNVRRSMVNLTKHAQNMEKVANEANEAKGEFLANMSHEIRTPMTSIIGLSELLDSTELSARQKEYNQRLKSSSINLLGIIENILDYSKIDAKKMRMEEIDFELNDVLYNLSNVVTLQAADKNIEFLFDINDNVAKTFKGDPLRIGQVLVNIVSNAIKFTEKGQVVLKIDYQRNKSKDFLHFSVIDSGIGMTKEEIDNIVHPFTQADSSFTRKYGGTGLGLTITHQLVDLMGGELLIESEKGKGSTFSFSLPLPVVEKKPERTIPKQLENLSILVIDDNKTSLLILNDICESFGFDVKTASTSKEAIKLLQDKSYNPNLIVIDYIMPDTNGIELTKLLKKKKLVEDLHPILMISAFGKENVVNEALEAGVIDFLDKPINPSYFYDTVLSIFAKEEFKPKKRKMTGSKVTLVKPGTPVILAEDNKINQAIVKELLTREGFEVTIANDGMEVLDILDKDEFDYQLILMDIQMPKLNGREATKIIRETENKNQNIPIVAMTAHALEEERQKCLEVGMNDFLTKPLEIEKLFNALSKYIDIVTVSVQDEEKASVKLDFLDSEEGLKNVGNDEGFFLEILYTFLTDYKDYQNTLENLYKVGEFDDIIIEAHTIKGLAATIGAKELFEHAKDFELKLRDKNTDHNSFTNFINSLRDLTNNLEAYFNANPFVKK